MWCKQWAMARSVPRDFAREEFAGCAEVRGAMRVCEMIEGADEMSLWMIRARAR
jgi:hypothetical protein